MGRARKKDPSRLENQESPSDSLVAVPLESKLSPMNWLDGLEVKDFTPENLPNIIARFVRHNAQSGVPNDDNELNGPSLHVGGEQCSGEMVSMIPGEQRVLHGLSSATSEVVAAGPSSALKVVSPLEPTALDSSLVVQQALGINLESPASKSWANLFKDKVSNLGTQQLEFIAPSIAEGKIIVEFDDEDVAEGLKRWEHALVGQVVGIQPSFGAMKKFVETQWKGCGMIDLFLLRNGLFVFKMQDSDHKQKILEHGLWLFANRPLILKAWEPNMNLAESFEKKYPIWIRFPDLKLHLWTPKMLSKLASCVGRPLMADECTVKQERLSFARVCVEVDVDAKLPRYVTLQDMGKNAFTQSIEYEWLPVKCSQCSKVGHREAQCYLKAKIEKKWIPKKVQSIQKNAEKLVVHKPEEKEQELKGKNMRDMTSKAVEDTTIPEQVLDSIQVVELDTSISEHEEISVRGRNTFDQLLHVVEDQPLEQISSSLKSGGTRRNIKAVNYAALAGLSRS